MSKHKRILKKYEADRSNLSIMIAKIFKQNAGKKSLWLEKREADIFGICWILFISEIFIK